MPRSSAADRLPLPLSTTRPVVVYLAVPARSVPSHHPSCRRCQMRGEMAGADRCWTHSALSPPRRSLGGSGRPWRCSRTAGTRACTAGRCGGPRVGLRLRGQRAPGSCGGSSARARVVSSSSPAGGACPWAPPAGCAAGGRRACAAGPSAADTADTVSARGAGRHGLLVSPGADEGLWSGRLGGRARVGGNRRVPVGLAGAVR